jgi:CSLREA domain-containing protein
MTAANNHRIQKTMTRCLQGLGLMLALAAGPVGAGTFVVDYAGDTVPDDEDANPGDGVCAIASPTSGTCSLRAAIQEANANPGADVIQIQLPSTTPIELNSPLPAITEDVTIDGTTQTGYSTITGPVVSLAPATTISITTGLEINAGSNVEVRALIITGFDGDGILLTGTAASALIVDNLIAANGGNGIYLNGSAGSHAIEGNTLSANGVSGGSGIRITDSPNNIVGGTLGTRRNVITQHVNGAGILIDGTLSVDNIIEGNYIGLDKDGNPVSPNNGTGIHLNGAGSTTIGRAIGPGVGSGNVISANTNDGILCENTGDLMVQANFIGTDVTGSKGDEGGSPTGNNGNGIDLKNCGSAEIGGVMPGQGNIISANVAAGVMLENGSTSNVIAGNRIGTDISGFLGLSNQVGVQLNDSPGNTLRRNLISGNAVFGVDVGGAASSNNIIEGNQIGTDISGSARLANGLGIRIEGGGTRIGGISAGLGNIISGNGGDGILLSGSAATGTSIEANIIGGGRLGGLLGNEGKGVAVANGASGNIIGGTPDQANLIAGNADDGVAVEDGTGNDIRFNQIHGNSGIGIDLGSDGATPNDSADPDSGPNLVQNHPVLGNGFGDRFDLSLDVGLDSTPNTEFDIDFYRNTNCSVTAAAPQGMQHIGQLSVTTDAAGLVSLSNQRLLARVNDGEGITATATDPAGNTSEFSNCLTVSNPTGTMPLPALAPVGPPPPALNPAGPPPVSEFQVNSAADWDDVTLTDDICADEFGQCTLRAAIQQANVSPGAQLITFSADVTSAITLSDALPEITDPLVIDGTSHPGFAGTPLVEIDAGGISITPMGNAVIHVSSGQSGILGLIIHGGVSNAYDLSGIRLSNNGGNTVAGNYIGTQADGLGELGHNLHGVFIDDCAGNAIGGPLSRDRNLISGNGGSFSSPSGNGIHIFGANASGNHVLNNLLGLDASAASALPNDGHGVHIGDGASLNLIGGTATVERNLISGNTMDGIVIDGTQIVSNNPAQGNWVRGNFIGADSGGSSPLGNGGSGVALGAQTARNLIGGLAPGGGVTQGGGNLIGGNTEQGVRIKDSGTSLNRVQGNHIGLSADAGTAVGNQGNGVLVEGGADYNLIGGAGNAAEGNLIGGNVNGAGVLVQGANSNAVIGNRIGTNLSGAALGNQEGVTLSDGAAWNQFGPMDGAGDHNVIVDSTNWGIGIQGAGTVSNHVSRNWVGTADGASALGNGGNGVQIDSTASFNRIGNPGGSDAGNLVSGNGSSGVRTQDAGSDNNEVFGNRIGTNAAGSAALPNTSDGMSIASASNKIRENLVSGNTGTGVMLFGPDANGNEITGNLIGTDATGGANLGNGAAGVSIMGGGSGNIIGHVEGGGNRIAFNQVGVEAIGGAGNLISGNAIFANDSGLGIDLEPLGAVNPNDSQDPDTGANNLQNYPVISAAVPLTGTSIGVHVTGTLDSLPNSYFTLQFYGSTVCDPSNYGEGETYRGSLGVTTDGSGQASFDQDLLGSGSVAEGEYITGTATDESNNTSEFSACVMATTTTGGGDTGGGDTGGGDTGGGDTGGGDTGGGDTGGGDTGGGDTGGGDTGGGDTGGGDTGGGDTGGGDTGGGDTGGGDTGGGDTGGGDTGGGDTGGGDTGGGDTGGGDTGGGDDVNIGNGVLDTPTPANPPPCLQGNPCYVPIPVQGGTPTYECSITAGALPQGLQLNNCAITGTAMENGVFDVTVLGRDSSDPPNGLEIPISLTVAADTPIPRGQPPVFDPDPAGPVFTFNASSGGPGGGYPDESVEDTASDAYGNRYIIGYSYQSAGYDLTLVKVGPEGKEVWRRNLGGPGHDYGYGVAIHPYDQSVYAVGYQVVGVSYRGILLHISRDGDVLWQRNFEDGGLTDALYGIASDSGGLYLVGESYDGDDFNAVVLKYDHAGQRLWKRLYQTPADDTAYTPGLSHSGGITRLFVGGASGDGPRRGWVIELDPLNGEILASRTVSADTPVETMIADDRLYAGGTTPGGDWWINALDLDLGDRWVRVLRHSGEDVLRGLDLDHEGWLYAVGRRFNGRDDDAALALLSPEGDLLDLWLYDLGDSERGRGMSFTPNGRLFVVGDGKGGGGTRLFEVEVDNGKSF